MKKILLPVIVSVLALLPFQKSEAIQFGEFKVGYTFRLKVTKVTSIKLQGATETKVPIPTGVPKYAKGFTIPFEIVSKGAVRTDKFTLPFTNDNGTTNAYSRVIYGSKNDYLGVNKSATNKAESGTLIFVRNTGTSAKPAITKVTYTLEKP